MARASPRQSASAHVTHSVMENDSYNHIGQMLHNARLERRLTFAQVSQLLHIRIRYLEALEQGRLTDLPGAAYGKGYLQAYAAFLDLDRDEILRQFEQVEGLPGKHELYLPKVFSKEKSPTPLAVWGGLAIAAAAYLLWFFVLQPPREAISVVEDFRPPLLAVSAQTAENIACFQPQDAYYPPCTWQAPAFRLIPPQGQLHTVMQLAQ